MAKQIIHEPLITEKAENISEAQNRYTFIVNRKANKLEIKDAIEKEHGVAVVSVNTATMPGKPKSRYTRAGAVKGQTSAYKKAIIRLAEGDVIDLYKGL